MRNWLLHKFYNFYGFLFWGEGDVGGEIARKEGLYSELRSVAVILLRSTGL